MNEIERNKVRLKKLMLAHGKTSRHIAILLARVTGDPLSTRTVQSWSASPDLVSARPCPGWALYILESELQIIAEESLMDSTLRYNNVQNNYK
ncbi:MAG: hypothetical protein R8G33_01520 [Gammaproteobacteria bacterium]|nr:hypothetical protein [Gammaproteobacteria bacterium]